MSDENKLIIYFTIILIIPFITFYPLEWSWNNDLFQKVVLAPLGEEPFKLLLAFFFFYIVIIIHRRKNKSINDFFLNFFLKNFIFFVIFVSFIWGIPEAHLNALYHIAFSSIGVVLILFTYLKVKNKQWKIRYKLASMITPISVSIFLHSLSNQFLYISYANNDSRFEYLVVLGRFIADNTLKNNTSLGYCLLIFIIALLLIIVWFYYLSYHIRKIQ